MNYYRRYSGDYLADTRTLSLTEHGVYALFLDAYYSTEKPLPAEYEKLYRICGAVKPYEQRAAKAVADAYFPLNGDGLRHNKRADKELKIAQPSIVAARENGRRGGRPMGNPRSNPVGLASGLEPPASIYKPLDLDLKSRGETQPPKPVDKSPSKQCAKEDCRKLAMPDKEHCLTHELQARKTSETHDEPIP